MDRLPRVVRHARPAVHRPGRWAIAALIILLGLAVVGVRLCRLAGPDRLNFARQTVKLDHVVDGDTLHLITARGHNLTVRLAGIDAPELGTTEGFRAALYLAEQLDQASRIYLEIEPKRPADKYGRTLGWVFAVHGGREVLVQEDLLRQGLAVLYPDAKGEKYYDRLARARPR